MNEDMYIMKKNTIIENYRNTAGVDSKKARELIKKLNYKEDFYLLQCIAQTYLDESRLDENNNMRLKLDRRKWRLAEKYVIKAFEINSNNPDVLYTMGGVRKANGQHDIAVYCFGKIIKIGIKKIAYGEYWRGIAFAKEMITDSKFELYRLYYETNPDLSKRYLSMYKKDLKKGISSIYKPLRKFLLDQTG